MGYIKKWATYPIPLWIVAIMIFFSFYFMNLTKIRPPRVWLEFSIDSIELVDSKLVKIIEYVETIPNHDKTKIEDMKFIRRYMYLQLIEYKQLFRMFYGTLTDKELEKYNKVEKEMSNG